MLGWIALSGVVMVILALWYILLSEPLRLHVVIATTLGVFFSVMPLSGLVAAVFYSDKSGYDQHVTDATKRELKRE